MNIIKQYKIDLMLIAALVVLSSVLVFTKLGTKELQDWDEGLYANIAGEMVQSGDYMHLNLQDDTWLEKEPLPFWLEALSIRVFGFNTFALRFPAAILSIFIAPLIYLIARKRLDKLWSFFASTLFLLSPMIWFPHMIRTADFDMLSLSLFLAGLVSYLYGRNKKWWWIAAVFLGLGLMSRGVMGILYLILIVIAELIRPFFELQKWHFKRMFVFLISSLVPWLIWHIYLLITYTNTYIGVYWKEQFFTRISDPLQGHAGSLSFYINFIYQESGWILIACFFFGVISTVYLLMKQKNWYYAFLLLWIATTCTPPHILTTKLEWYILPALPALYISILTIPHTLKILITNKKIQRITLGILAVLFLIYTCILIRDTSQTIKNIEETPTQIFLNTISHHVPQNQSIVLYGVQNWNHGRTLPAFYWYLHYEQNLDILSINKPNIEYYLARREVHPWWIITKELLLDIEGTPHTITSENQDYLLLYVAPDTK